MGCLSIQPAYLAELTGKKPDLPFQWNMNEDFGLRKDIVYQRIEILGGKQHVFEDTKEK